MFLHDLSTQVRRALRASGVMLSDGDGRKPRGEGGPPDLEELWQDFNRRLNSIFSGRLKGGRGGPPGRFSGFPLVLAGLAGAVVIIWLGSGFYQIPEGSAGVVLRLGRYHATTGPGPWYHLPYPIESVEKVSLLTARSVTVGRSAIQHETDTRGSAMLTSDENIVDVPFEVQYRVSDPAQYLFHTAGGKSSDNADDTVTEVGESAVREVVGGHTLEDVLYGDREAIRNQIKDRMQQILERYDSGLVVTAVNLGAVQAPEQVQDAFEDAIKASQDAERSKNDGQAYANTLLPKAQSDAAQKIEQAEGYRATVVAQAQGDAERFKQVLAEYTKAPQITRERMYLQAMQDVLTHSTKVLIDSRSTNNQLYLPLDKLIEQSRQSAASAPAAGNPGASTAAPASAAPAASTPVPIDDARSRDAAKGRDRESR